MDEQSSVEQPAVDSAQSVTDTLMDRWSEPDDTPADTAPNEDNAAVEGDDAPVEVEPETAPDEGLVEVEFEGKTHKVPQELKDALLRQSDYTRKTQEVAEERRLAKIDREQVQIEREFQSVIGQKASQLQSIATELGQYRSVDWDAAYAADHQGAARAEARFNRLERDAEKLQREIAQDKSHFDAAWAAREQEREQVNERITSQGVERTRQHAKTLPGWSEQADVEVAKYLAAKGVGTDMAKVIASNPTYYEVLYKSWKYDQLQNAKPQVEKRVASLPKPVKPGSSESRVTDQEIQSKKAVSRLKQTGSPSALRDVLALRLKG